MTCGAAARTAMVAMIVKAVKVMRQSLSNTCSGDLEGDEHEDEDVQQLGGDLEDDENGQDDEGEDGDDLDDHEYVGDFDV